MYLSPAPLYHSAPLVWSMTAQRLGGTVVVMEHFDPERCLALMRGAQGHARPVRPDHVRAHAQAARRRAGPLRPLLAALGGARRRALRARGQAPHDRVVGAGHPRVLLGHRGHGHDLDHRRGGPDAPRLGGQGHLGRGARLRRRRARTCPSARTASSTSRGRTGTATFQYNHDPEKTRQTFNDKGWSTLWDVGHLDDEGYLYLTDRKLFMIVSGGVNIYPQEIEDVLVLHPAVADVAVFGIPEPEMGEEVKAVVQPAPGVVPGPELEAEIIAFCRANLSHYKCPRTVDFTDALPRGENGKLYKKALREVYWASSAPSTT